jgi:hypothetical protein
MGSIHKIIGVLSCSVVLCLSLFNVTQATEKMKPEPCPDRKGGSSDLVKCNDVTGQNIDTVTGEVLGMDGNDVLVQRFNGKEVRLHLDANTQMTEIIGLGDRIEAKLSDVNERQHVLSIRQLKQ